MLVALDSSSGQVLGAVTFVLPGSRYSELAQHGEAEFRTLAVDPAAQRRGVARTLVRACLDHAAELGCSAVVISVRDFAEPARRLYAGFGFARWPERDWSPLPGVQLLALRLALPGSALVRDEVQRDLQGGVAPLVLGGLALAKDKPAGVDREDGECAPELDRVRL